MNAQTSPLVVKSLQSAYRSAFDSYPFIALNHLIVGLLCCILAQFLFDISIKAIAWYAILILVITLRYRYIRSLSHKIHHITCSKFTYACYSLSSSAIGFVWSGGAIITLHTGQENALLPVVMICCGLAFGGIIYHINFKVAFHAYFWALLGPVAIYLICVPQEYLAGGTIIVTGLIYLFIYASKLHRLSIQWIRENIERDSLITELSEANNKIKELSETDALTGLKNRTHFNQLVPTLWKESFADQKQLCVVIFDIDYFKPYNDHYGHIAGDNALKSVAKVMRSVAPPSSNATLFRVGGEEFLALLPKCDIYDAVNYADEIRCAIEEAQLPHEFSPCNDFITISVGVTGGIPAEHEKPIRLIDIADKALYQAKEAGRNYVSLQHPQ